MSAHHYDRALLRERLREPSGREVAPQARKVPGDAWFFAVGLLVMLLVVWGIGRGNE